MVTMREYRSDVIHEMGEPLDALCMNKDRSKVVVGGRNGEVFLPLQANIFHSDGDCSDEGAHD